MLGGLLGLAFLMLRRRRWLLAGFAGAALLFAAGCGTAAPQNGVTTQVNVTATSSAGNTHTVTLNLVTR